MINTGAFMSAEKLREYQGNNLKELKKFDIDLDFGTKYEQSLANILKLGKIEVKTERDKWNSTRNVAIELSCNNNLSGLNTTEADYWAHILTLKGAIKGIILLPVERLKEIVKLSIHDGNGKVIMGGDNDASEIALIPLKDLADAL
tara:strand:+ start:4646 stop:5083 length:438 start_codon:yes stop_codon:yes gene_type:complete